MADVLGNEVGDRQNTLDSASGAPLDADPEDLVICVYEAPDEESRGAAIFWQPAFDDFPDSMPEEMQAEQSEERAVTMVTPEATGGEEIDVEGATAATVRVTDNSVAVFAAVGGAVLNSAVVSASGSLGDDDVQRAVDLVELAIAAA